MNGLKQLLDIAHDFGCLSLPSRIVLVIVLKPYLGFQVAPSRIVGNVDQAVEAARELGFPVLARAAYALGGLGSGFANNEKELRALTVTAFAHSKQVW